MTENDKRRLSIPLNILKSPGNTFKNLTNQRYGEFRRVSEDVNIPHHVNNSIFNSVSQTDMEFRNCYPFTPNNITLDNRVIKFGYASLLENVKCETILESNEQVSEDNYESNTNCDISLETTASMVETFNSSNNKCQLFLLRKDNFKLVQLHSKCLSLKETINLWYTLPEEVQENILVMIDKRDVIPNNNYDYFWIEDCYANTIKILSISNLMEVCKNKKKSVRWRNLSNGIIFSQNACCLSDNA